MSKAKPAPRLPASAYKSEYMRYAGRIGRTPKERLQWLLGTLNEFKRHGGQEWVAGDWDILRGAFAVFTTGDFSTPGYGAIASTGGVLDEKPSTSEVKDILEKCLEIIERVADHKPVEFDRIAVRPSLHWIEGMNPKRYVLMQEPDDNATWIMRVCYPLAKMISAEGQRILRCSARRPHERFGCGRFFVKNKRGKYCGQACTSRETSRRKRKP